MYVAKYSVAKYSGYHHNHHHHVEDYDYVEDIDEYGYDFDDTVNDNYDSGLTLVSVNGIW